MRVSGGVLNVVYIAVGVILFVGGFLSSQVFFESRNVQTGSEKFSINGNAVIKAYHDDGTLYKIWEGHNTLTEVARNEIAACATGTPFSGECSSWITLITIQVSPNILRDGATTNTLLPKGCNPNALISGQSGKLCTGWKTEGTFVIPQGGDGSIYRVYGYPGGGNPFDMIDVSPAVTVTGGDKLIVTITFTIA